VWKIKSDPKNKTTPMKKFLMLTAISEGLIGIALIGIPNIIVLFLLGKPANGTGGVITAMIAGAAILSLAVICWLLRESANQRKLVKGMLFYNCLILSIAIYGVLFHGLTGPGLWLILFSHAGFSVWGAVALRVK
jgi:hypothetical protein